MCPPPLTHLHSLWGRVPPSPWRCGSRYGAVGFGGDPEGGGAEQQRQERPAHRTPMGRRWDGALPSSASLLTGTGRREGDIEPPPPSLLSPPPPSRF